MLNTRSGEQNIVFYLYLPCVMNAVTLNSYMFLSNTGSTWRKTSFVLSWLRHGNTSPRERLVQGLFAIERG